MNYDFTAIIADYRERCARRLQEAAPGSAAESAYKQMLWIFDADPTTSPNTRVVSIPAGLMALYRAIPEPEVYTIVREWADNFIRDTGQYTGVIRF